MDFITFSISFSESLCIDNIKEQQPAIGNRSEVMVKAVIVVSWVSHGYFGIVSD